MVSINIPECVLELRDTELFSGLGQEELFQIAPHSHVVTYPEGATIFRQGEEAEGIFTLQEGVVVLKVSTNGHRELAVSTVRRPGEIFGWSALVEPHVFTASAVCVTPTRVLVVDGPKLRSILRLWPSAGFWVMWRLASVISARLHDSRSHLVNFLSTGRAAVDG